MADDATHIENENSDSARTVGATSEWSPLEEMRQIDVLLELEKSQGDIREVWLLIVHKGESQTFINLRELVFYLSRPATRDAIRRGFSAQLSLVEVEEENDIEDKTYYQDPIRNETA